METPYDNINFENLGDWRTKAQITEEFPQFKKGQLEWMLMPDKRKGTDLNKVVRVIGRTLYIHRIGFSIWIANSAPLYLNQDEGVQRNKDEVA